MYILITSCCKTTNFRLETNDSGQTALICENKECDDYDTAQFWEWVDPTEQFKKVEDR
ncbi:hypothetical protein [Brevibacillus porteri]|uniref:hypothetical protein n=1 Tax=Brevibacillus porteri TaxID=2126350 RepID=UPI003637529F